MAVWKLQHSESYPQEPYLFFVAFADQEVVDKLEESHIIHPNLEIVAMAPGPFRSGRHWQELLESQPELAGRIETAPLAVALHGPVVRHESLDYLRDTLEVMTSLVDHGACAVYDLVTWTWYSAEAWLAKTNDGAIFNPFDHVEVITTPEDGETSWLRTSGLRKFGRPDLSVRGVRDDEREGARKMLDRFINHLALGGLPEPDREVQIEGLQGHRAGPVQGGAEDSEFHNHFFELTRVNP